MLDQSYKLTPEADEFINAPKEEISKRGSGYRGTVRSSSDYGVL